MTALCVVATSAAGVAGWLAGWLTRDAISRRKRRHRLDRRYGRGRP
jgi:hypothetical protein